MNGIQVEKIKLTKERERERRRSTGFSRLKNHLFFLSSLLFDLSDHWREKIQSIFCVTLLLPSIWSEFLISWTQSTLDSTFERCCCSNGNLISNFRHLYIRYIIHRDVSSGWCEKRTFALVISILKKLSTNASANDDDDEEEKMQSMASSICLSISSFNEMYCFERY